MSDDQRPSFFSGLPPREGSASSVKVLDEVVVDETVNDEDAVDTAGLDSDAHEVVATPTGRKSKISVPGSWSLRRKPAPKSMRKSAPNEDDEQEPEAAQTPAPTSSLKNKLALVAFIGAFLVAPVGIICGHLALKQIKRTGQRGRRLALAGTCIGYVGVVAWVAVLATLLIAGAAGPGPSSAALQASVAAENAAETAKNEAIIAAGGGAVEGHTVSAELCATLDAFVATSEGAAVSAQVSPELLAATEALAAVESPNQKVYQGYLDLLKDPASIESIADAQALSADFAKATQVDVATCAVGL